MSFARVAKIKDYRLRIGAISRPSLSYHEMILLGFGVFGIIWLLRVWLTKYGLDDIVLYWDYAG